MKSQSKYLRMVLVLSVMVLFSLCAVKVRPTVEGSLKRVHRAAQVEEGEVDNEMGEMEKEEKFEEEERERGDHPDEAARFRRLQLQDEKGNIPIDGLEKARQQVKRMKVSALADARQSAGVKPDSWSWMGPGNIGGRIRSIVISPTNPDTMWIGSVSGGIWRTDNGGDSWFPVNDFLANLAVSTMVINPITPSTMYAGTGEINAYQGAGIFKSTDSGLTWNQLPKTNPADSTVCPDPANCPWLYVNRLAISPNGNTILAATWQGIQRSTNGGATWNLIGGGVSGSWLDIDFHPTDNQRAIAGASGVAIFSTDGGVNWNITTFNPLITGRVEMAYAPSSPNVIYASVNRNNGEVYRSTDGNSTNGIQTFTLVNTANNFFLGASNQGEYDNTIWVNPQDPADVIVGGIDLWRSGNSGTNFTRISTWQQAPESAHADHHVIVSHPGFNNNTNLTVYFGNDGGIYRADNIDLAGLPPPFPSGWTQLNNNLGITQFYGAAGSPTTGVIIGGTQDNGTLVYSGSTNWAMGRGGDGGFCAADPIEQYFYGEYVNLQIYRSINGSAFGDIDFGISDARNGATSNFIAPFILDPNDSNTMLAGGISLWRTNNVKSSIPAPTWTAIKTPSGTSNPISAIAVSPINSNLIVVGHNNGDIYRTLNGTATMPIWTKIDTAGLPDRFVIRLVVDSTRSTNWIYVTFGGFSADNVYRTTDNGSTWTSVSGTGVSSLPAVPVRSLVYHPRNPNLLYVGTEIGVFTSDDAGATWEVPQNGPANVSVGELFWMGGDLIAATYGRGLFRASGGIYVDCNWNGAQEGTFEKPFRTVTQAVNAATGYRTIWLKPCSYNETFIAPPINKKLEFRSLGGTAKIGTGNP